MRRALLLLALLAGGLLAGCGSSAAPHLKDATLVLDFTPNAVHTGIYAAIAQHYDRAAGVRLHVIAPSASTDSIKLLETGRASFAILDIHDLAIARERGEPIVGITAIVERPLAAVLAGPKIRTPKQLEGKLVGVTGVPSDTAVLDSIVQGAGGNPALPQTVTIGFNAVADLLAGRVAAATAFWNDEGITLQRERPGFHVFRVERYGAPAYPELILCAAESTVRRAPGLARSLVAAIVRGYGFALAHPSRAAANLERLVPALDPALVRAQLDALLPAFRGPGGQPGELDAATLRRWASWEVSFGVVSRRPDVATMFDRVFIPRNV
jgi:NitT/TauT family transport system substrate-binding protein/putative hydroxymethylpyrimidine transport system substrate-binding protein